MKPAAAAMCLYMDGRSRVVTTGSGGRPYTSGSSSRRKKAPSPPTPSSGSSPYKPGLGHADVVQLLAAPFGTFAQLVEVTELDGLRGARLGARGVSSSPSRS